MMNRRGVLIAFALVLLCALFGAWWMYTFERVEEDVPVALKGEARYNPLYGLKKVLQARGIDAVSRANVNLQAMSLGMHDTVVLAADARALTDAQAEALLAWVEDGGHLLFAVPPGSEGRSGELFTALHLGVVSRVTCLKWPSGQPASKKKESDTVVNPPATDQKATDKDESGKAEYCFTHAFLPKKKEDAKGYAALLGDDKGYYLGRRNYGDGDWTVAGNLGFLYTDSLKQPGYAEFAWQVLAPVLHDGAKVHLVYAADVPPLHVLLVRYGWPALVPALLALFAWLWARSQRFGPLLPVAAAHRRALREHIQAAGEFTFRRRRAATLYAPLRRAFDERLRRDAPALAAFEGEALVDALAARSGLSPAVVRLAIIPFNLAEPEHFYAAIKTLTELRAKP